MNTFCASIGAWSKTRLNSPVAIVKLGLTNAGTDTVLKPESNLRSPLNSILPAIVVVDELSSTPPVIVIMLSTPPVSVHATPNSNLPCSDAEVTLGAVALILANCWCVLVLSFAVNLISPTSSLSTPALLPLALVIRKSPPIASFVVFLTLIDGVMSTVASVTIIGGNPRTATPNITSRTYKCPYLLIIIAVNEKKEPFRASMWYLSPWTPNWPATVEVTPAGVTFLIVCWLIV